MKNIFLRLSILILLIYVATGCSSDDSIPQVILPVTGSVKKITETIYYGLTSETYEIDFNYENGALKSISSGNLYKSEFFMDGNKVIQTKSYSNNILTATNNLSYDGINLKSIIQTDNSEKTDFTYANGLLSSSKSYYSDNVNGWIPIKSENYFFNSSSNNNKRITTNYQFSNVPEKTTYEFDSKNSVFKNMNIYLSKILLFESFSSISTNNIIKQFSYPDVDSNVATQNVYYTIVYNSTNFPINIKKYSFQFNELLSECTIVYN